MLVVTVIAVSSGATVTVNVVAVVAVIVDSH